MSVLNPDLLCPVFDKNRDEIFLVEYEGFIKNITEGIIIGMLLSKQKWIKKYPKLKSFDTLTNGDIYDSASLYHPEEYLKILSEDNNLSSEEILKDIQELQAIDTIQYQQITLFEFTLRTLLQEKFIKRCHIIKSTPFYNHELEYIKSSYINNINKLHIVSGTTQEAFSEYKPTTCFTGSMETLLQNIDIASQLSINNVFFVLRNTSKTVFYNQEDRMFHYYPDAINKIDIINKSKKFYIGPMYTFRHENVNLMEPVG